MQNRFSVYRAALTALMLTALAASPLCAQTPPATPPANAAQAKASGDWGVRCAAGSSVSPCEMVQVATQNKTGRRVLSVSLAFVPQNNRYIFQLAVPLGVLLAKGVKIIATGYNEPAMIYRRCDSAGCYVEGLVDAEMIDALAKASGPAKVEITSADGRTVDLPFSLRGFSEARKNMEDLARQKAVAKP